jgi:hypothetical protein
VDQGMMQGCYKYTKFSDILGSLVDFFLARAARGARALAARARMFVMSRVPFFPNQQYEI